VAIVNALQLEAHTSYMPVVLDCFWPNFYMYCACALTAISELPIKILISPLDSASLIS